MTAVAMGTLESLLVRRDQIRAVARRHRGRSVSIFGSVARGEDRPGSDVDFLVEFDRSASLFDLLHLEDALSQLLQRPVDVISDSSLKPRDEHIRSEAVSV